MDISKDAELHIGVISNIIFDPHFPPLVKLFFGENTKIYPIPYGEHNEDEYIKQLADSDFVLVWLDFETLLPDARNAILSQSRTEQQIIDDTTALYIRLYSDIRMYSNPRILWFLFEDYSSQFPIVSGYRYDTLIDKINIKLTDTLTDTLTDNITFINLQHLIAKVGVANTYDPKGKYRWSAPYSKVLIETVVKEIHQQYLIEKGFTKKCLVLDCDNVLWGGILSEDGIENIQLGGSGFGKPYQDFQRFILSLYYHGVILAVCSKNDLPDIMTMFREHSEMILKEEHIACFQVNWENKPNNIKRIAEILNIGIDSIVFVDDSPIEVEAVKSMLPEVIAILYERDFIYNRLTCFNFKSNVNIIDIEKRNETYRTNQSRETLISQCENYDEYIAALEVKIDIHQSLPIEYSRIAELTQRVNKCTNGIRYTVAGIKSRVAHENVQFYSLLVSDRFSDLGLVGVLEIEDDMLTLFCLSCRALGREIERKLLEFIVSKHRIYNIAFNPTGKNDDIKLVFLQFLPDANLKSH
jgi:FkbH-like protein